MFGEGRWTYPRRREVHREQVEGLTFEDGTRHCRDCKLPLSTARHISYCVFCEGQMLGAK